MKPTLTLAVAAAVAAGAFSIAAAQQPLPSPSYRAEGPFVSEPVASLAGASGDADSLKAIADALNAEPSLKNSKITVQKDGDAVLLTGTALTRAQHDKASAIAASQAGGEGKVVNAMLTSEILIVVPEPQAPATVAAAG
jgi:hypothetical protein